MLDWLTGKKEQKPEKKDAAGELGEDEKWIYDYMRSYLTSPIWRNPLMDFIEEHCVVFEDSEENKFEYTKIFQEFQGLTALLLESMIDEVGITESQLEKCIIRGLRRDKDSKIFKQILLCDNFEAFKKVMVQKNKELEVEAMRKMQDKVPAQKKEQAAAQIEIDAKQLQRLELEKAIAMSMAVSAKTEEDKQLEEAIKLSQMEYEKQHAKKEESPKKSPLGPLPPLVLSTHREPRPVKEYKEEESKLKEEISDLRKKEEARQAKAKEDQEGNEERKKRLQEQRELIRKQKQEQRKEELHEFVKSEPKPEVKQEVSPEQMERRRNLMKKLKEQLKD